MAQKNTAIIDVATGEVKAAKAPAYLQALALGSCVAVILYDEKRKIGGIAHVMLPSSIHSDTKAEDLLKHANHAIHELVKQMQELGAIEEALTARIVGGALVVPDASEIGKENIEAVRNTLKELNIRIADEHLSGTAGRSALFNVATGELQINGKVVPIETTKPFIAEVLPAQAGKKNLKEDFPSIIIKLEEKIVEQTKDLNEKAEEADNIRKATVNLLEDLENGQKKLTEEKVKYEALLESIGDGVVAVDQEGKIILINPSAEQMLGLSAEQVVGKLIGETWKVVDEKGNIIPESERPIEVALKGKTTTTTTTTTTGPSYFYTKKNGGVFPVAIIVTPVVVGGKIIGAIDVFHDITKEKELEKMRTDFLSLASHQLRTPLSGTKWLIETMQKGLTGKIEKKEKEYLDNLYQMNERMIKLVFDMLSVLRLEGTAEVAKKEVISAADLYKDLAISMAAAAESKGVILNNALKNNASGRTSKKIEVETDIQLLKTILECFVSNAINYTPSGKEVILDATEAKDKIIFSVKDNGIGIPKNEQAKIFERFYRASNAKVVKPEGTGLGLYIAKMLAEKTGATISFESEENKGSTFYLNISKKVV